VTSIKGLAVWLYDFASTNDNNLNGKNIFMSDIRKNVYDY
jgi:fructose-specific component phosphotransferase system IIB-like protein